MSEREPEYLSYLLRIWRESQDDGRRWRASLEDTANGEVEGFSDIESLIEGLRQRTKKVGEEEKK